MSAIPPLPALLTEPVVRAALLEDLGRAGDITTDALIAPDTRMSGVIAARAAGVVAGTDAVRLAFSLLDPEVQVAVDKADGARVKAGEAVLRLDGLARAILSAERVALNLLCRLSGIATATAAVVQAVQPYAARVTCTRKTTPGLRALEKHAVRCGGGANHRFGLDDAMLIKERHVALAGGIVPAIARARRAVGHLVKIEVEVDTLEQLDEAVASGVDAVLLDNMTLEQMREAVRRVADRALTEASGRITPANANAIAATGVDILSTGYITHSAPILDLALDAYPRLRGCTYAAEPGRVAPGMQRLCAAEHLLAADGQRGGYARLTTREREIAALVCRGYGNRAVGAFCGVSETTVKHHLTRIFEKLGLERRSQLIHLLVVEEGGDGLAGDSEPDAPRGLSAQR